MYEGRQPWSDNDISFYAVLSADSDALWLSVGARLQWKDIHPYTSEAFALNPQDTTSLGGMSSRAYNELSACDLDCST